jgi:hypothetical protein
LELLDRFDVVRPVLGVEDIGACNGRSGDAEGDKHATFAHLVIIMRTAAADTPSTAVASASARGRRSR